MVEVGAGAAWRNLASGQAVHLSWLTWGTCNVEASLSVSEFSVRSSDHSVSWPREERVQHMEHDHLAQALSASSLSPVRVPWPGAGRSGVIRRGEGSREQGWPSLEES